MNSGEQQSYSVEPEDYIAVLNEQCNAYRQEASQLSALVRKLIRENKELSDALTAARQELSDWKDTDKSA